MRRLVSLSLIGFLLTVVPLPLAACDICGCFIGVTPYDNQSGFMLQHRYSLFSRIDASGQPLVPSGAYRLPASYNFLHTTNDSAGLQKGDFESYKTIELKAKWFIHQRVEVNFFVPFVANKEKMSGELSVASGLGDPAVWVGYHLLNSTEGMVRQRLILGAGVKFPLGSSSIKDEDGERLSLYMQPGTGSFDETAYLQYAIGIRQWGGNVSVTGRNYGTNAYGEQVCPSFTGTMNVFYMFRKNKTVILPELQVYAEHTKGVYAEHALMEESEVGLVTAGVGCEMYFGRLGVHFSAQLPVAEVEYESSPRATFRGSLGLSWNINQTKFIIHNTKEK